MPPSSLFSLLSILTVHTALMFLISHRTWLVLRLHLTSSLVDVLYNGLSLVLKCLTMVLVPQFTNTVAEIYFDSTLINKDVVHTTVSHNALVFSFELHECKLKRISSFPVSDHLT